MPKGLQGFQKGNTIWKGKKRKKFTEQHRKKLSETHKGKKASREARLKMSKRMKENNPMTKIRTNKCSFKKGHQINKGRPSKHGFKPGDKHPRWNPDRANQRDRGRKRYIEWRSLVYQRDNWACQDCGKVGKNLNAHHIKEFSKFPKLRFDVNNGITLCEDCHKKVHKRIKLEKESSKTLQRKV